MKYNIKKMINAATKNVYKNSSAFHQYNVARLGIKENAKIELPTFSKQGQQKHVEKQRNVRLVENLPQLRMLTDKQWQFIELVVSSRKERYCPICFGTFGAEPQIVTSCRHTMHEKCLAAYYKKYPNKLSKCVICMQDCTAITSQRLLNVSYTLCIIDIQTAFRARKAFLQKEALQTMHGGKFDKNVSQFNEKLEQMQNERQIRFEKEVEEYMRVAQEADRLYEQFLMLNNATVFEGIQLARKRHCSHCAICYEDLLNYHYMQFDGEMESSLNKSSIADTPIQMNPTGGSQRGIIAMSCCGSLFHVQCLRAAEDGGMMQCCYCRQSYFAIPVILVKYFT